MATRPSAGRSPTGDREAEDGEDNNMAVAGSVSEELQDIELRRDLRRKYRELREELADSADALGSVQEAETFAEKHVKINTLFKSVNNIRELGIDADTLNDLSKGVRSQASKLSDISASFNFRLFAESITTKYTSEDTGDYISWAKLGRDCGGLFSASPLFRLVLPRRKPLMLS
jgi:hypothetical protein